MKDQEKTREQLSEEVAALRQQLAALEASEHERRRAEEALQQSREPERQLAEENAFLSQIGRIISSTLDIDEVYEQFAQEVKRLADFDRMAINVIDHEAGSFVFKYVAGLVQPGRQTGDIIPLEGTQTQHVMATGSAMLRPDVAANPGYIGDQTFLNAGMRSGVMVPLNSKGRVIGTLSLRSRHVSAYGLREQSILGRLADQIAPAVENAELYDQTRRAEEALQRSQETERRLAQENALLANIGRIISSTLDIDSVYEQFSQEVKKLVEFDRAMINKVDVKANTYTLKYYFGPTPSNYPIGLGQTAGRLVEPARGHNGPDRSAG